MFLCTLTLETPVNQFSNGYTTWFISQHHTRMPFRFVGCCTINMSILDIYYIYIYNVYIYIYSYINFRCVIIMEILKCFSLFRHEFMPFLLRTGGKGEKGKKGEGDWKDGTGWNGAPKTPIESWKGQNIWPGIHRERPDSFSSWVKPDIQTSPPPKKKTSKQTI